MPETLRPVGIVWMTPEERDDYLLALDENYREWVELRFEAQRVLEDEHLEELRWADYRNRTCRWDGN